MHAGSWTSKIDQQVLSAYHHMHQRYKDTKINYLIPLPTCFAPSARIYLAEMPSLK